MGILRMEDLLHVLFEECTRCCCSVYITPSIELFSDRCFRRYRTCRLWTEPRFFYLLSVENLLQIFCRYEILYMFFQLAKGNIRKVKRNILKVFLLKLKNRTTSYMREKTLWSPSMGSLPLFILEKTLVLNNNYF